MKPRVLHILGVKERICEYAGISVPALRLDGTFETRPSHTVSGNPVRFNFGPVTVRPDEEWRTGITPVRKAVVVGLILPLLLRFGYEVRTR